MTEMRIALLALGLIASTLSLSAEAKEETPDTLKQAMDEGFKIVGVVGQGLGNQDHVIYLQRDKHLIVCGFRFVLTEQGFDQTKSGNIGVCTGLK
jgi:hypothetical protein